MAYKRLGDLLTASGTITEEQLQKALSEQKDSGKRLGDMLIDDGIITEDQLIDALQMQLGVDYVDPSDMALPLDLARMVPKEVAQKYSVVPVRADNDKLYLAMADPLDFVAQEEVKNLSRRQVIPLVAKRKMVERGIMKLYGNQGAARVMEEMIRENSSVRNTNVQQAVETSAAADAPTIRFVNTLIERAFMERASDIHLEPQEYEMVVRMRIDGVLRQMLTVPVEIQNTVISRLKILGGMNISERKIPQDGHAMMTVHGHPIDLRISSLPTIYGESMVLRILDKSGESITKESIGLTGDNLEKYNKFLKNSSGVVLLVGPTGSGKSTTLYTMIKELCCEETNIITLEDPVEYNISGVNQCQINEKTGMTFANGLRAILRQDPDIICVGEIRDGVTASIAIRAAITGHFVLSTLHTNDAASTFARLEDIGVEPYLTISAMRGIISQRLVRKLCPNCKRPYRPTEEELEFFNLPLDGDYTFYAAEGCTECSHTGYHGRTGVFEILEVDRAVRKAVESGANGEEIMEAARPNGFRTMRENCADLVVSGVTSMDEAMKAVSSAEE